MKNNWLQQWFGQEYIESTDDRLVIVTDTIGRQSIKIFIGWGGFALIGSVLLLATAATQSNKGSSVTLTCDPIEDYINCSYRQVNLDGTVAAEETLPRVTETKVVSNTREVCDSDGDCTHITECSLVLTGRSGDRSIPFETFNPYETNCTVENQINQEVLQLIQGETKTSLFRLQEWGTGDLWPAAWDWARKTWLISCLMTVFLSLWKKQVIWNFDRNQDKLFVDTISFFGKRKLEIPLNDLIGIDYCPPRIKCPPIKIFIKKGDKLDEKNISINVQKIGIGECIELVTPWLNQDYRVYRTSPLGCDNQTVLTIDKQTNEFHLLSQSFKGKTNEFHLLSQSFKGKIEEIAAIAIEEKLDSDGDVAAHPGLKLHTGVFYPCFEEFWTVSYQTWAKPIADFLGVEVETIVLK